MHLGVEPHLYRGFRHLQQWQKAGIPEPMGLSVIMSGVILRAIRSRDNKTFSDALARDLSQRRGGRNKINKANDDLTESD